MTAEQREKVGLLNRCVMLPGSWDKRFSRSLAGWPDERPLSPRQVELLDKLVHRYRRQIGGIVGKGRSAK